MFAICAQAIDDGVFRAELNELLTRELAEDGYSGVTVRRTMTRTDIIIRATRTQKVLGANTLAAELAAAPVSADLKGKSFPHSGAVRCPCAACASSMLLGTMQALLQRPNAEALNAAPLNAAPLNAAACTAGEQGRRIRELTSVVQKRWGFADGQVELFAEKVMDRGLCAVAQAESLRYKLLGGLAVRRCAPARERFSRARLRTLHNHRHSGMHVSPAQQKACNQCAHHVCLCVMHKCASMCVAACN